MTPAERFVVVAGVFLLLINLILFGLCLSLVLDSRAARNDTAQLITLTGRLLENQQTTPLPNAVHTTKAAPETTNTTPGSAKPETTIAQEAKVFEGCPLRQRSTSTTSLPPKDVQTQEVTGVAMTVEPEHDGEPISEEPIDTEQKIRSMEERIIGLEKLIEDVLKKSSATELPIILRRRRNRGGRGEGEAGVGDGGQSLASLQLSLLITTSLVTLYHCI